MFAYKVYVTAMSVVFVATIGSVAYCAYLFHATNAGGF